MSDDLIARLRSRDKNGLWARCEEAADRIMALEAELALFEPTGLAHRWHPGSDPYGPVRPHMSGYSEPRWVVEDYQPGNPRQQELYRKSAGSGTDA